MPTPKKFPNQKMTKQVNFRVPPSLIPEIRRIAESQGGTIADYVRGLVVEDIMKNHQKIRTEVPVEAGTPSTMKVSLVHDEPNQEADNDTTAG